MQLAANQPPAAGQPLAAGQPPAAAPTSAVNRRGRGSLRDVVVSLLARAAQLLGSGGRAARYPATQQAMRSLQDALEVEFATASRGPKKPGNKCKGTGYAVTKSAYRHRAYRWKKRCADLQERLDRIQKSTGVEGRAPPPEDQPPAARGNPRAAPDHAAGVGYPPAGRAAPVPTPKGLQDLWGKHQGIGGGDSTRMFGPLPGNTNPPPSVQLPAPYKQPPVKAAPPTLHESALWDRWDRRNAHFGIAGMPPDPPGQQEGPPPLGRPPMPPPAQANLERRVASATPVSLVEGMDLYVDTSGHVVNRAGVRVDAKGRPTKPRGAPGKGSQQRYRARQGGWVPPPATGGPGRASSSSGSL